MTYYGQMGQDKFLDTSVFLGMRNGVFVDVGAHDGESLSNTYFFEKERGWTGLCVEPIPSVFAKLQNLRTRSKCYQVAIDRVEKESMFLLGKGYPEMFSVLTDHLDERHSLRIQNETRDNGGNTELIPVQTKRLDTLFKEQMITHVNYMSIDVEGAEFGVLHSIDFSTVTFDIIEVECNYDDLRPKYKEFFESKGFIPLASIDWDILYIHKDSKYLPQFQSLTLPLHMSIFTHPWKNWKTL
jgi:FkbM family methyltransferase